MRTRLMVAGALVALVTLSGAASGGRSISQSSRWEVFASVVNGSQLLSRISDSSTPGHRGAGDIDSAWHATWKVRVKVASGQTYVIGRKAHGFGGTSHGEYRGYYPKSDGSTASYRCRFRTTAAQAVKRFSFLQVFGTGPPRGTVHVGVEIHGEPARLPALNCTGDELDAGVPKTVSAGVLTGIETACFGDVPVKTKKLKAGKSFTVKKHFGWHPTSPSGLSRPCSGFGSPIRSSGEGTIRLIFHPD